jgi:hypothetical protein
MMEAGGCGAIYINVCRDFGLPLAGRALGLTYAEPPLALQHRATASFSLKGRYIDGEQARGIMSSMEYTSRVWI